jgi:(S)-mandelate dehydrogenase
MPILRGAVCAGNFLHMSRIDSAINIDDLKRMAKRRLSKIMFDFIQGGVEDEIGLHANAKAFRDVRLVPRYCIDISRREQRARLFDRSYASPFGIAPTGMAGAFRRDSELYLAQAAAAPDIPYLMSGAANASMEQGARLAPKNLWYQISTVRGTARWRRIWLSGLSTAA